MDHSPCAVWAYRNPLLDEMQRENEALDTLHIFSDGPATQSVKTERSTPSILSTGLTVDEDALNLYPADVEQRSVIYPVVVTGDGNCLPYTESVLAFGHKDYCKEMRVRIVFELAIHKELYLSNEYLRAGLADNSTDQPYLALVNDIDKEEVCMGAVCIGSEIITCSCRGWSRSNEALPIVTRPTSSINVGSNYNEWREPVFEIGHGESDIGRYFIETGLHVDQADWEDSCKIMDKVMRVVAREMKNSANIHFPGLVLDDNFIKQGSSREGLKVCDSLEFDFISPFRIEGLRTQKENVFDRYGNVLPGFFKEKIINDYDAPPWMRKHSLLEDDFGEKYINTNNFQKKVFTSLLDKSRDEINSQLQIKTTWNESYRIVRSVYAPNLKITLQVRSQSGLKGLDKIVFESSQGLEVIELEADLVPAICLSSDTVPDPYTVHDFHPCLQHHPTSYRDRQMPCERYGVMKWVNESTNAIPLDPMQSRDVLWRNSTCGYEKHILDVARRNQSQRYILTACRLFKGALHQFRLNSRGISQLDSVVKSYHLKNICLYCILFLTIASKENKLSGVKEALGYFIKYLHLSIDAELLPHFFYGNPYVKLMFPWSSFEEETYNLFSFKDPQTLRQARLNFPKFLQTLKGLYYEEWMLDSDKVNLFEDLLETHSSL
ncbi:uncharacterized protein LOC133202905 [Saccostrea echinata]|uniref:uncharacterized protein LOC133202905 n=1 Tax=Saccostrea echinata TaxID=191078 RepID=UPI002A8330CC|nr:uncharacterized protein LOC133202905 [Saccostrea echinata]